jgi:hypothetical protein
MHFRPRSAHRARAAAAVLVLALHALALLLLLGSRLDARRPEPAQQLEGMWIHLPPLPRPPVPEETPQVDIIPPPDRNSPRDDSTPPMPSTAITLPPAPESSAPSASAGPRVDWFGEAAKLASGFGEKSSPAFGTPVEKMREPCKPPKRSFKWKSEQKSTGSAGLTLGWEEPDPDKHFFDDMKKGRTPESSVPDPNICD